MSTYSTNLALELIGTGEQAGVWGNTTNTNLGTLIEQAISGYVTQAVATGTDTTITIPNGATGVARNMYIELTGTGGTNTNLIVPANKKLYFIFNNSTGAVTVKVSGQTGVSVPQGKKVVLTSNGTDIVNGLNYIADFGSNSATITQLTATSATITNLTLTSLVISNLSIASANITTLTSASATITNLLGTTLTISGNSFLATSSGNVGVGTTSPASKLTVSGDVHILSTNYLNFTNTAQQTYIRAPASNTIAFGTSSTEQMRLDSSGNLGIGTASPANYANYRNLAISGTTGANIDMLSGSTKVGNLFNDGTNFYAYNVIAGALVFGTNNTERMRLDTSGNLGIGTASPGGRLHITTASGNTDFYHNVTGAGTAARTVYTRGGTIQFYAGLGAWSGTDTYQIASSTGPLTTIDSSGNLGIGTASPIYRLHVQVGGGSNNIFLAGQAAVSNGYAITSDGTSLTHSWATGASATMAYVSNNLGIGTTSPAAILDVRPSTNNIVQVESASHSTLTGLGAAVAFSRGNDGAQDAAAVLSWNNGGLALSGREGLAFATGGATNYTATTERMRLDASGNLGIGTASPSARLHVAATAADVIGWFDNSHASTPYGLYVDFSAASPDNNSQYFFRAEDSTAVRCYIWSDGDLANHDGVYGTISDQRLKQDIVDANSQWDDLKAVRFRKYRMKTDVQANPDSPAMLGVVAQELEAVCPGLVDEHTDTDGETTKTVKSSILLMKAAVALQEAMARIETLEAKVAALEAK